MRIGSVQNYEPEWNQKINMGKIKNQKIDPNSTHELRSEILKKQFKSQSKYNIEVYVHVSLLYVVLVNKKKLQGIIGWYFY